MNTLAILSPYTNNTMKKAVIYIRTSTQVNVGEDKDSDDRQIAKGVSYAEEAGIDLLTEGSGRNESWVTFYDAGVSGTTDLAKRPAFVLLIHYCQDNDVDYILVEDISRFSRDVIITELGRNMLKLEGLDIVPVNAPDLFLNNDATDPTRKFIRMVLAAVSDLERNMITLRLQSGRRKACGLKRQLNKHGEGKCGGAKGYHEFNPDMIRTIQGIKANNPQLSLRGISQSAFSQGLVNSRGKEFTACQIRRFLSFNQSNFKGVK